jgi:hypothetical protein
MSYPWGFASSDSTEKTGHLVDISTNIERSIVTKDNHQIIVWINGLAKSNLGPTEI